MAKESLDFSTINVSPVRSRSQQGSPATGILNLSFSTSQKWRFWECHTMSSSITCPHRLLHLSPTQPAPVFRTAAAGADNPPDPTLQNVAWRDILMPHDQALPARLRMNGLHRLVSVGPLAAIGVSTDPIRKKVV
jgi:hypothetical protein